MKTRMRWRLFAECFSCQFRRDIVATALCVAIAGCSRGPAGYDPASFDSEAASELAMEAYDSDSDGFVANEELSRAPGLNAALATFDENKDGKVSAEEVANRVKAWDNMKMGITNLSCEVTLDGQPLEGATVTFDPEEFQGGATEAAVGVTSILGFASPVVPKENRPSPNSPAGIQPGLYKVRISKKVGGAEILPSRYNSETVLGQQVSQDDPAVISKRIRFNLTSKK